MKLEMKQIDGVPVIGIPDGSRTVKHPHSRNRDNHRFPLSLPNNFLENKLITYTSRIIFRILSEDYHIVARSHLELSRFRESGCKMKNLE